MKRLRARRACSVVALSFGSIAAGCSLGVDWDSFTAGGPREDAGPVVGDASDGGAPDGAPCSADLASDPANCGRCGRTCATGACLEGACAPGVVYEGLDGLRGLAGVPGRAAWTSCFKVDGGGCVRGLYVRDLEGDAGLVALSNLEPSHQEIVSTGAGFIVSLITNNGATGSAGRCSLTGSCNTVFTEAPNASLVAGDGNGTYLVTTKGILGCETGGCGSTPRTIVPVSAGPFVDVMLASPYLYWVTGDSPGKVRRVLRSASVVDGGVPVDDLAIDQGAPRGVTVDATTFFWTTRDTGRVLRCDLGASGCAAAPTVIYEDPLSSPTRIITDGLRLYFIAQTGGRVLACPADGACAVPTVMFRDLVDPQRLAFAGDMLLVADVGAGKVLYTPK